MLESPLARKSPQRRHSHPLCQTVRDAPSPKRKEMSDSDLSIEEALKSPRRITPQLDQIRATASALADLRNLEHSQPVSESSDSNKQEGKSGEDGRMAAQGSEEPTSTFKCPETLFSQFSDDSPRSSSLSSENLSRSSTLSVASDVSMTLRPSMGPLMPEAVERMHLALHRYVEDFIPNNLYEKICELLPGFAKRYGSELVHRIPEWRKQSVKSLFEALEGETAEDMEKLVEILWDQNELTSPHNKIIVNYLRMRQPEGYFFTRMTDLLKLSQREEKKAERILLELQQEEAQKREKISEKNAILSELVKSTNKLVEHAEQIANLEISNADNFGELKSILERNQDPSVEAKTASILKPDN